MTGIEGPDGRQVVHPVDEHVLDGRRQESRQRLGISGQKRPGESVGPDAGGFEFPQDLDPLQNRGGPGLALARPGWTRRRNGQTESGIKRFG